MISFYPGPSRIHDEVPRYVKDAYKEGILSMNHRSEEFMKMSKKTVTLLKQKLGVPKDYTVLYTSSATECWEIIAQSVAVGKSHHFHNGAFGQKWFEYTRKLRPDSVSFPFGLDEPLNPKKLILSDKEGLLCVTQNETSNGTQVTNGIIRELRKNNPDYLIAVDATSSMGGIRLDFAAGDLWLASVQKCFGLPAGLGLLICSPNAVARARAAAENKHYNSLPFLLDMADKWQTSCTPNVLGIYLLMRVLENSPAIQEVHEMLDRRYRDWIQFLSTRKTIQHLVTQSSVHSTTVLPISGTEGTVSKIKKLAKKEGILLGEGYGEYKPLTFRIANFPALKETEIKRLRSFLEPF
jgi:phosphoserine aminotransferase